MLLTTRNLIKDVPSHRGAPNLRPTSQAERLSDSTLQFTAFPRAAPTIVRETLRILTLWRARSESRRELRELRRLAPQVLEDIGVNRGQIIFEASKPFWRQ